MTRKRGLGKGIDALFGGSGRPPEAAAGDLREMPVGSLRPGKFQPRRSMAKRPLDELVASIRERGVIQPIIVRPAGKGFEIIAGERRWQAAKRAGLGQVPVRVCDYDDQQAMYAALVENLQREDLNAADLARGVRRLIDEFGLSHEQAAKGIGVARATVSNLLRILGMHPDVLRLVEEGRLEMGHARALAALPQGAQRAPADKTVRMRLSVRQTEELVRRILQGGSSNAKPKKDGSDPDIDALAADLSGTLGTKVAITASGKSRGRLVIHYRSLDTLDRIIRKLEK